MINPNEEIYFPNENIFDLFSEVLRKNGLYETAYEVADKKPEDSLIIITFKLTENFAKEKISDNDFVLSLQKQLKISSQVAENLAKDIEERILPQAQKIIIGAQPQAEKPAMVTPSERMNEILNVVEKPTAAPAMATAVVEEKKSTERKSRTISNTAKPTPAVKKETSSLPKKSDNYREPIE